MKNNVTNSSIGYVVTQKYQMHEISFKLCWLLHSDFLTHSVREVNVLILFYFSFLPLYEFNVWERWESDILTWYNNFRYTTSKLDILQIIFWFRSLSGNHLVRLEPGMFTGLIDLKQLYVSYLLVLIPQKYYILLEMTIILSILSLHLYIMIWYHDT